MCQGWHLSAVLQTPNRSLQRGCKHPFCLPLPRRGCWKLPWDEQSSWGSSFVLPKHKLGCSGGKLPLWLFAGWLCEKG